GSPPRECCGAAAGGNHREVGDKTWGARGRAVPLTGSAPDPTAGGALRPDHAGAKGARAATNARSRAADGVSAPRCPVMLPLLQRVRIRPGAPVRRSPVDRDRTFGGPWGSGTDRAGRARTAPLTPAAEAGEWEPRAGAPRGGSSARSASARHRMGRLLPRR